MVTLPRWAQALLAGAVVLASAFLLGRYVQRSADQADAQAQVRQHFLHDNADSLRRAAAVRESLTRVRIRAELTDSIARAQAAAARETHAAVRHRVHVESDSTLAIDHAAPIVVPPLVIATLRSADDALARDSAALAQDSVTMRGLHAELASVTHERDLWHARSDTLQAALEARQPPRLGFKAGAVVGGAVVYAVTHPDQVKALVRWIIHVVP